MNRPANTDNQTQPRNISMSREELKIKQKNNKNVCYIYIYGVVSQHNDNNVVLEMAALTLFKL